MLLIRLIAHPFKKLDNRLEMLIVPSYGLVKNNSIKAVKKAGSFKKTFDVN